MQTAFCLAEGVITLTAHPHPQKSAQTFIQQRRARKGRAQGGKVGFATPNAFPPRNLAHATVSPGKESAIHASRIQALPSRDIHLRLGFILKLRYRCYRRYRGFIEVPGYIPIENRHAGLYIRYQPDKRKIKCKHGKNNPRHKAEQHLQVLP